MRVSVAALESRAAVGLRLRIVGPGTTSPSEEDLRRLFRRRALTRRRRASLRALPCVVATDGDRVVGFAAFEPWTDDLRVHELACAPDLGVSSAAVVGQLLQCLELAAIAGGARRVVIMPWAVPSGLALEALGYAWVGPGRRGLSKTLF